jgi:hypothetical protein
MANISGLDYEFVPVVLTCEVTENVRRMKEDGRDEERIRRAMDHSRAVYDSLPYTSIDTTNLTVDEVVDRVCELL